jgi:YidC/Oxa1 family membrane protein insertase
MFSRSNLVSKYKACAKSIQGVQNNLVKKSRIEPLQRLVNSIEPHLSSKQFHRCRNFITESDLLRSFDRTLSSIQDKFNHKKNEKAASNTLLGKKFALATAGVASVGSTVPNIVIEPIPEPPPVPPESPEAVAEVVSQVNALGEATFASLGLGGNTPVGFAQSCFEYLHVTLGVPWWEAIVLGTLFIRLLLFPLVVIAQRNAARMNNYLPQLQAIQLKMTEARQMGNQLETARYSQELMIFMKEKQLNPLKNMIVPLAQMPVFVSFFMGLRGMANVPVESLRTGGLWWFTDLTVPDQYFLMPLITSATLYATIELGTDSAKLSSQNLQTMKYVLRALPLVVLPFTINFPGAILCYWVSSNFISLLQVGILRIPAVRDYFKIEPLITHKNLPVKPKGFTEGLKDSWTNIKITKELEERRRVDEMQFQRAGRGPIVKTYKYDPTKQSSPTAISAKKR